MARELPRLLRDQHWRAPELDGTRRLRALSAHGDRRTDHVSPSHAEWCKALGSLDLGRAECRHPVVGALQWHRPLAPHDLPTCSAFGNSAAGAVTIHMVSRATGPARITGRMFVDCCCRGLGASWWLRSSSGRWMD